MLKHYFLLILFSFPIIGMAQTAITDEEKQSFVNIYMSIKADKISPENLLAEVLKGNDSSIEFMQNLKKENLTPEELEMFSQIKKRAIQLQAAQDNELTYQYCKKYRVAQKRYQILLNHYKTNIEFQQELRPFFDKYLKDHQK